MTYLDAVLFVLIAIASALAVTSIAAGRLPLEYRRRHHEVGSPVFNQVGVMFSILLAFVFSDVWGEYNTAAQAISDECGALHGAAILAATLPHAAGAPLVRSIDGYVEAVAYEEWPTMRGRQASRGASEAMQQALSGAARLPVTSPTDQEVKPRILSLLSTAHAARETRLFQMTQALPTFLWAMLIILAVTLVLFVAFSGLERGGRQLFVAIFAGSIALVLVTVRMLDYPFEGALALPSSDYHLLLGKLKGLLVSGGA